MEAEGQECGDGGAAARVTLDARVNSPISSLVSAAEATAAASAMAARPSRPQRGDTGVCYSLSPHLELLQSLGRAQGIAGIPNQRLAHIPLSRPHLHTFLRSRHGRQAAPWDAVRGRVPLEGACGTRGVRRRGLSAASRGASSRLARRLRTPPHPPTGDPSPPFAVPSWAWRGHRSPIVSLASSPHLPVSTPPTPGPGLPLMPLGSLSGREGAVRALNAGGGGLCLERGDGGSGPGMLRWRGCGSGHPGTRVNSPISSLFSAAQATAAAAAAAAMAARPLRPRRADAGVCCSLSPYFGLWWRLRHAPGIADLAAQRLAHIPASRPHLHPFRLQSRPPGCTLGRGAGEGPPTGRVCGARGVSRGGRARREEVLAPARLPGSGPHPIPPPEPPALCSQFPCRPGRGGVGAQ